jgi:hypothetical protein
VTRQVSARHGGKAPGETISVLRDFRKSPLIETISAFSLCRTTRAAGEITNGTSQQVDSPAPTHRPRGCGMARVTAVSAGTLLNLVQKWFTSEPGSA